MTRDHSELHEHGQVHYHAHGAVVIGYEAIERLIHPQPVGLLWAVVAASVVGFVGNEAVAVFRIRVGRQIGSAALVADGYHARTDGWTSLAVVVGAGGVWLGYPLADPIVGLIIAAAILVIVWQSGKTVFSRLLDGVDPEVVDEIRNAAGHVEGVQDVAEGRARGVGHPPAAGGKGGGEAKPPGAQRPGV